MRGQQRGKQVGSAAKRLGVALAHAPSLYRLHGAQDDQQEPQPESREEAGEKAESGKPKPWTRGGRGSVPPLQKVSPAPQGELQHVNPYTLLVAVVLSAQATDAGVNKATPALFAAADTPEKMAALGEDKVRDFIKTIGLFRNKAKNVVELSRRLVAEHGGQVPRDREALEALPGVGRKTANVVLNVAFGEKTIAVDTHIFRVGNRTNMAPGLTPFEVELKLEKVVPDKYKLHAHHWLILHGRYTCVARKPLCETCVINDLCHWPEKTVALERGRPTRLRLLREKTHADPTDAVTRIASWAAARPDITENSSATPTRIRNSGGRATTCSARCRKSRSATPNRRAPPRRS